MLTTITVGCYFSWWIVAFNIVTNNASRLLVDYYIKKCANLEISTDEFMSRMTYIMLGSKLLFTYPLVAFSVYLIRINSITSGLVVNGAMLGSLLILIIFTEALVPIFSKGYEIYAEKHAKDLIEEDLKDREQKETDLLRQYDP